MSDAPIIHPQAGGQHLAVTALTPTAIGPAQSSLIPWVKKQIEETTLELREAQDSLALAKKNKWRTDPFRKAELRASSRLTFLDKLGRALSEGFHIIPNFADSSFSVFAVRTNRTIPLAGDKEDSRDLELPIAALPAGEGHYVNPNPEIQKYEQIRPSTVPGHAGETAVTMYFSEHLKDVEFPLSMARPEIMEVTSRAMALNLFDRFGILPAEADNRPGPRTRVTKPDPIIIGQILDPQRRKQNWGRRPTYHAVTFLLAWHLDTRSL